MAKLPHFPGVVLDIPDAVLDVQLSIGELLAQCKDDADLVAVTKLLKRVCVDRKHYYQAAELRDIQHKTQNQTKRKPR